MAGKPDDAPRPDSGNYVVLTATQIWSNLPQILGAGLLFSVACAPAFVLFAVEWVLPAIVVGTLTIGPAWSALLRLEYRYAADKVGSLALLPKAFVALWQRSVAVGSLALIPLLAAWGTLVWAGPPPVPNVVWAGLVADLVGALVLAAVYVYAFPLLAVHDVGVYAALRNGLILASRHIANTLGLLAMIVLAAFGVVYLSVGLLFILPALYGMFVVNNLWLVMGDEGGNR